MLLGTMIIGVLYAALFGLCLGTTSKDDVVAEYEIDPGFADVINEGDCASSHSFGTFFHDASNATSNFPFIKQFNMRIPHSQTRVGTASCDSTGLILAVESTHPFAYDRRQELVDAFCRAGRPTGTIHEKLCTRLFERAVSSVPFIFGYDWDERTCRGRVVHSGTAYLFVRLKWPVLLTLNKDGTRISLEGGVRYLFVNRLGRGACIYKFVKDNGPGPESDPTLSKIADLPPPSLSEEENSTTSSIESDLELPISTDEPTRADGDNVQINDTPEEIKNEETSTTTTKDKNEPTTIGEAPLQVDSGTEPACFPGDALVTLVDGNTITMRQLELGHRIRSGVGSMHSDVYAFTHADPTVRTTFVQLETSRGGVLTLSSGHYVYADGVLTTARRVNVGARLESEDGSLVTVRSVRQVYGTGLYAPHTLHGDVIVNGIRVSSYTDAVHPKLAHLILAPVRWLHRLSLPVPPLHRGISRFAFLVPGGPARLA